MRSAATLLVEGSTDRWALARLSQEAMRARKRLRPLLIDTAELIRTLDAALSNREKVEHVHQLATQEDLSLGALVDREFRAFNVDASGPRDEINSHYSTSQALFWTRGHSIENYLFDVDPIVRFLEINAAESVSHEILDELRSKFERVLRIASAFSWAARECNVLTKCSKVFTINCWSENDGHLSLNWDVLHQQMNARAIEVETISQVTVEYAKFENACLNCDLGFARWSAHGSIAYDAIWAAVGNVLARRNVALPKAEFFGCGNWEAKFRFSADSWAVQCCASAVEAPTALIEWLRSS